MLRIFPGTLKLRSSRAGGGWRAFACVALALAALAALPPRPAYAKHLAIKEVLWQNHLRQGGVRSEIKFDTTVTNVNGAMDPAVAIATVETTLAINVQDMTTPPWFTPPALRTPGGTASTNSVGGDSLAVDTVVVARFVVYTDSTIAQNLTAITFNVDVLPGPDRRATDVTNITGVQVHTLAYTSMGSKPVYSFPIFWIINPRLYNSNIHYSFVAGDPSAAGGMLGQPNIRVRLSAPTGILRRARAQVEYYVDGPGY